VFTDILDLIPRLREEEDRLVHPLSHSARSDTGVPLISSYFAGKLAQVHLVSQDVQDTIRATGRRSHGGRTPATGTPISVEPVPNPAS